MSVMGMLRQVRDHLASNPQGEVLDFPFETAVRLWLNTAVFASGGAP
jgi:hypothetical protein